MSLLSILARLFGVHPGTSVNTVVEDVPTLVAQRTVSKRWKFMSRFVVGPDDNPMIVRWRLIQTPWFGIYLHFIHREDLDRHPHDHPWTFWSFVLRGGYEEEYCPDARTSKTIERIFSHPNTFNFLALVKRRFHKFPLRAAHRIIFVAPGTITLVLAGPKVRDWGFWLPDSGHGVRWMHHKEYERQKQYERDAFPAMTIEPCPICKEPKEVGSICMSQKCHYERYVAITMQVRSSGGVWCGFHHEIHETLEGERCWPVNLSPYLDEAVRRAEAIPRWAIPS